MSFFEDCLGDEMISAGSITVEVKKYTYVRGILTLASTDNLTISQLKSYQPLMPDEIVKYGFGEYPHDEFYKLFTLDEIPIPNGDLKNSTIFFNNKAYTIKKVLPWRWQGSLDSEGIGYFEYIISRRIEELNVGGAV